RPGASSGSSTSSESLGGRLWNKPKKSRDSAAPRRGVAQRSRGILAHCVNRRSFLRGRKRFAAIRTDAAPARLREHLAAGGALVGAVRLGAALGALGPLAVVRLVVLAELLH